MNIIHGALGKAHDRYTKIQKLNFFKNKSLSKTENKMHEMCRNIKL